MAAAPAAPTNPTNGPAKQSTAPGKRFTKEPLTPHRLTVAVLIREFFKYREQESCIDGGSKRFVRDFCLLVLDLVHNPDLELDELRSLLASQRSFPSVVLLAFDDTLERLANDGISCLYGFVADIGRLVARDPTDNLVPSVSTPNQTTLPRLLINRGSVGGHYLRRLLLNFELLSFSEVTSLLAAYVTYYHPPRAEKQDDLTEKDVELKKGESAGRDQWLKRQAELFMASQATLLINNDEKALEPNELHGHIKNLLKSNPDQPEAHFLNYLNYLRVNEYCGAVRSLYHSFDRTPFIDNKGNIEDKGKMYRYASLNLAILHYHFGHKEEAFAALKEAIMLAQEGNDELCLQHALSWLYCLTNSNKDKLLQHSILKSLDLNYPDIVSLGIQSFVEYAGVRGGTPKYIFETLTRSDIINYQHSYTNLTCINYAQKAALWLFYGKTDMSSLWGQLLLYLNSESGAYGKITHGEALCQAMCNLANRFLLQGDYSSCYSILNVARERFPHEPLSRIWTLCTDMFDFVRHFHRDEWSEAETAAQRMAVLDSSESKLRLAELYLRKRDYPAALRCVREVLEWNSDSKTTGEGSSTSIGERRQLRIDYHVRAQLTLAEAQYLSAYPNVTVPDVLAVTLANASDFFLDYYQSLTYLHLAHVLHLIGTPAQALRLLDRCLVQVLAHGGAYDRARAVLLHAKCLVANSRQLSDETARRAVLLNACEMLDGARRNFGAVEAYSRVQDVLYLQTHLYNELKMQTKRNKCALDFRLLQEEHPSRSDRLSIAL